MEKTLKALEPVLIGFILGVMVGHQGDHSKGTVKEVAKSEETAKAKAKSDEHAKKEKTVIQPKT
ncbi:hypothetical protein ACFDTO_32845 [Microbacteriaceae bacterium 4G12]